MKKSARKPDGFAVMENKDGSRYTICHACESKATRRPVDRVSAGSLLGASCDSCHDRMIPAPTHTPGPWVIQPDIDLDGANVGHDIVTADGKTVIVTLAAGTTEEELADAHLIAAAPDLLAALEWAIRCMKNTGLLIQGKNQDVDMVDCFESSVAAIAKAEDDTGNAGCDRCGMFDRMPHSKFCEGCTGRGE